VIVEIPFGKYRGAQVSELPFNYLEWLTSIELLEPLRTAVKAEYERRLHAQDKWSGPIDLKVVDEIISAGVRSLARTHHPDAGGDHQKMVAINNAADWLREKARDQ
jgi:putative quorum-sensing-regulated virulence factor